MKTVRSYTWPVLLALVSALTAFSDVVRNNFLAELMAYSLLAVGIAALVLFKAPMLSGTIRQAFPAVADDFSPVAFALSCSVLAVAVYGFAQISSQLGDQGGVIAAAYPEVEQLQAQLGVVDAKVTQIAATTQETAVVVDQISDQTAFLTEAAGRWIGVSRVIVSGGSESFSLDARLENSSSFVFDNVRIIIRDADDATNVLVDQADRIIVPNDGILWFEQFEKLPQRIEVCVSGRRRDGDVWTIDRRIYGDADTGTYEGAFIYRVVDTTGLTLANEQEQCV
jgi:hypothetical protein